MIRKRLQGYKRLSDSELVGLLLANDEAVVDYVFFHRCNGIFTRVINDVFQSKVKKEELITDFYLYLRADDWRRLRQFEFRSELNTWLTIVAIRFFSQKNASMQTRTEDLDPLLMKRGNQIPDSFDIFDEMSRLELYEAIDKLPQHRERMALLGELAGKKTETIAEELGCTVAAVYNLTKKARKTLKKRMKGNEK